MSRNQHHYRAVLTIITALTLGIISYGCAPGSNGSIRQSDAPESPVPLSSMIPETQVPTDTADTLGVSSEDEHLRVQLSKANYRQSEDIDIKLTVIGEGVYFHGPCNWWFERRTQGAWQKVGECNPTITDEPFAHAPGSEIIRSIPSSNTSDIEYDYKYQLLPGSYRFAIAYWDWRDHRVIYSPPFKITND